jgi:hypothetical protein
MSTFDEAGGLNGSDPVRSALEGKEDLEEFMLPNARPAKDGSMKAVTAIRNSDIATEVFLIEEGSTSPIDIKRSASRNIPMYSHFNHI